MTCVALGSLVLVGGRVAHAEEARPSVAPAPYSLPWSLRPAVLPNVIRVDSAIATSEVAASVLTLGVKATPRLGVLARLPFAIGKGETGVTGVTGNLLIGVLYSPKLIAPLRLGLFAGYVVPLGMGGGNRPSGAGKLLRPASLARSAMDNALFASNYTTVAAGASFAYVDHGLTAQVEATVYEAFRVQGERAQAETTKTNLTTGAHLGYALTSWLVPSGELRYQSWLSTPKDVSRNEALRDSLTVAVGLRTRIPLGDSVEMRPGVAYVQPIDAPMTTEKLQIVVIDFPFVFR